MYKNVFAEKIFLHWLPSAKQNVHVFIYTKSRKNCETFVYIYKNPDTLQKVRQFALWFYSQKSRHLTLHDFSWFFLKLAFIYIQKAWHFALRQILNTKSQTLQKEQENLRYVFYRYKKPDTLCYMIFHEIFEIGGGGGGGD